MAQQDSQSDAPLVVNEITDDNKVGTVIGQCKWFSNKLGFGFITIVSGDDKGKDIFVHHTGVKPLNSQYKTLVKGEYVQFDVTDGSNGLQAVNVRGIQGGSLMCDVVPSIKFLSSPPPPPTSPSFTQVKNDRPPRTNNGPTSERPGTSKFVNNKRPYTNKAKYNKNSM